MRPDRARLLLTGILVAAALGLGSSHAARAEPPLVVLELFTSQGCSSCPPADAMMPEWASQPGILPLSLHVDYWDYLGWRDTFGKKGHSKRQHEYARNLGARQIYTPQVVVNGQFQAVGSDREAVARALYKARKEKRVALQAERVPGGAWRIRVPAVPGFQGEAKVLLCRYDRRHDVSIERGENHGRTISYVNVARSWNTFGQWTGTAASYTMPDPGEIDWHKEGIVVMLQSQDGPILGAVDLQPPR